MKIKVKSGESLGSSILNHLFLLIAAFFAFGPFLWMFLTSIKSFPTVPKWDNFEIVFSKLQFSILYFNTFFVTILMIVFQLLVVTLCAFAFARLNFPGKNFLFLFMLALMMVPSQIFIIPRFKLMVSLGLSNTLVGLALPGIFNIFGVFLMKQFFETIPKELDEAARIDGAGYMTIYWRIVIPLSKSGIVTLAILTMLGSWKDLMWPLINNSLREKMTLAAGLAMLIGEHTTYYEQVMAGAVIAVLPLIVIFILFQKQFVEGIAYSGLKG